MSDDGTSRPSHTFPPQVVREIQRAADAGVYEIRGYGAKRKLPTFDDLLLLGASMSRYPLEGYRERCATDVLLGGHGGAVLIGAVASITMKSEAPGVSNK